MTRLFFIDFLRGIAILGMILFHTAWDIAYFSLLQINLSEPAWKLLQTSTATLFLLLVGMSLVYSYYNRTPSFSKHTIQRALRLFGWAAVVSFVSFLVMPDSYVFFGILHLISFAIGLASLYVAYPLYSLIAGIGILILGLYLNTITIHASYAAWLGIAYYGMDTLDYYPVFPWFGVILLGCSLGHYLIKAPLPFLDWQPTWFGLRVLAWMGRHSLAIYFLHIPVIFSVCALIAFFKGTLYV